MYRSKVCVQEFSYFVTGLDIQLEKSEYDSPVRKKIGCSNLQVAKYRDDDSCTVFFQLLIEPMA